MAPVRPASSSSAAGPNTSSGRPKIFSGGTRHSARIAKRTATEDEGTKEPRQETYQAPTEAESERDAQPQRARPGSGVTETRSSRRLAGSALPSDRCLRRRIATGSTTERATNQGIIADDNRNESEEAVVRQTSGQRGYHTIAEGGPKLKNIAELIAETDRYQHFNIPSDMIIASEDVDRRIHEQMLRRAKGGNLTADRVRKNLVISVREFESWWRLRKRRDLFWKRVCKSGTWMSQLDGDDCSEFFLRLCKSFRRVPGKDNANDLTRAFDGLVGLFRQEEDCELQKLVDVQSRPQAPVNRSLDRSRDRAAVSENATAKKRGGTTAAEDGNIFRWSADTNMTDFELSGIDVEGLTPIVDVGDRRRKNEEWKRQFDEEIEADGLRIDQELAANKAVQGAATTPQPQPAVQGTRCSSRTRPTPYEVGNSMPQMGIEEPARAARKFSQFEEDDEDDDGEEEERQRANALKRQKLLQKHAARGGPKSD